MVPFRLTLRNYRCFGHEPVVVDLQEGFTSLIGPNNAGKSTLLKFIHELRELWERLAAKGGVEEARSGNRIGVSYKDVVDAEELFCNRTDGDLQFEINCLGESNPTASATPVTQILGTAHRDSPNNWRLSFLDSTGKTPPTPQRVARWQSDNVLLLDSQAFDFEPTLRLFKQLKSSLFVPAFRNSINEGAGEYYGLKIGTGFVQEWSSWKTSGVKSRAKAIESVTEDIRNVFGFGSLEINASGDHKSLMVSIDRQPYRLAELGSGIAQFIIVFGNAAIRRPSFIMIDEPEINLHPSLQIGFVSALAKYSAGNLLMATHSMGLARTTCEVIYSFQRKGNGPPLVGPFAGTKNYAEFVGEMSYTAFQEIGFEAILLVEGVTDVKTYQQFLRLLKRDASVVVIPLGGSQMIRAGVEIELAELTRITARVFAIVDSERIDETSLPKDRVDFEALCKKLGIACHLTERRAIENYFTDAAVKAVLGSKFGSLTAFQPLKEVPGWNKGLHNWQIASRMTLADVADTDVGKFLNRVFEPAKHLQAGV